MEMQTKLQRLLSRRNLSLAAFASACVVGSFLIGIQTAGDVQPFTLIEAQTATVIPEQALRGDMDGNGTVDVKDALRLLEIIQGIRAATEKTLEADPDGNGTLTLDDVRVLLQELASRSTW